MFLNGDFCYSAQLASAVFRSVCLSFEIRSKNKQLRRGSEKKWHGLLIVTDRLQHEGV
jgi:hypothetical protein